MAHHRTRSSPTGRPPRIPRRSRASSSSWLRGIFRTNSWKYAPPYTGSTPGRAHTVSYTHLVMTSDELLEGSDTLYESLVIMGGGVIGVEFATFYANLGCRVDVYKRQI